MNSTPSVCPSTRIRQHPERAAPDQVIPILERGHVVHVAFVENAHPVVIPTLYHFEAATPDKLWLHGSQASRLLAHLASGARISLAVTVLDELVFSRDALNHSADYHSVVGFGRAEDISEDQERKNALLERMIARYFPGRQVDRDYAAATAAHLQSTRMLEVTVEAWSGKVRDLGPNGPRDKQADGTTHTAGTRRPTITP